MSGMKTILNDHRFNARVVEVVEPVESDDLSRFEGEGGLEAPEPAGEWIDIPLEHGLWRRHRRAADQSQSDKPVTKRGEDD